MKKILAIMFLLTLSILALYANQDNETINIRIIPNPFERVVNISSISIQQGMNITVTILDNKDQIVKTIFNGVVQSRYLETSWDATNSENVKVKSGKYFVTIEDNSRYLMLKKVVILK